MTMSQRHWKASLVAGLCAAACPQPSLGQVAPATILEIVQENQVQYLEDISDPSKFATDPSVTRAALPATFKTFLVLADIVAVNGQAVKGTVVIHGRRIRDTPTNPGEVLADIMRTTIQDTAVEILAVDGRPIGSIMLSGLGLGPAPPGAPLSATVGNQAIVGGTGAFLGARGQLSQSAPCAQAITVRVASIAEDPASRRKNGGGRVCTVLHVIPMARPEIVTTPNGPAITHSSDFSFVTTSKPAAVGEILSLFVTGLGPTRPGVDPGKPFPTPPLAVVNSPVDVTVNGKSAEVIAAVGFPGAVDGYQVNFRVPADTAKGSAVIQVTAAWIAGSAVSIPIQ